MTIHEKLSKIQSELKVPKNQLNKFGNYNYRSCEDITEALKPYLKEYNVNVTISDEIVLIGERYYVKATATINDLDGNTCIQVHSYAREEENKKGMDSSQLTGATSSYARKYALNGLFLLDDNKDSDDTNTHGKDDKKDDNKPKTTKTDNGKEWLNIGKGLWNDVVTAVKEGKRTITEIKEKFNMSKETEAKLKELTGK